MMKVGQIVVDHEQKTVEMFAKNAESQDEMIEYLIRFVGYSSEIIESKTGYIKMKAKETI